MKKQPKLLTVKPRLTVAASPKRLSVSTPSWKGWYSSKLWKQLRHQQLTKEPLCEMCLALGRVVVATVVDHKTPHKGNWSLFADATNLQSLDKQCHDSVKQRMEKRGIEGPIGGDLNGMPLDPNHHWNA